MTAEIPVQLYDAFRQIRDKDYAAAESLLKKMLEAPGGETPARQALIHSTLGILYKVRGEVKEAWRHYERAEKFLPDDPSLKIIVAKFLIDQFAQYDAALKRMKKVLRIARGVPSFEHQARAISAIAYLRKGERGQAKKMLEAASDFEGLATAENINLDLIEALLARNFEPGLCRRYLEKGMELARQRGEDQRAELFGKLIAGL